jgi:hypothetical protein
VRVFVQGAAELAADDAALVIRQRDGRLDPELCHQLAMQDRARGAPRIALHFAGGEPD